MNTGIKFVTSLLFIVVSGISFSSQNIELGSSEIHPHDSYSLDLSGLLPGIPYKVSCNLRGRNDDYNRMLMRLGFDNIYASVIVKLNGEYISDGSWDTFFQLPAGKNEISFDGVYRASESDDDVLNGYYSDPSSQSRIGYKAIEFRNYDWDDGVALNNCIAVPISK